jgi:hypothetical protein
MMTPEQIKSELAQLGERIALAGAPTHQVELLQLRQAKFRREMLLAELSRVDDARDNTRIPPPIKSTEPAFRRRSL